MPLTGRYMLYRNTARPTLPCSSSVAGFAHAEHLQLALHTPPALALLSSQPSPDNAIHDKKSTSTPDVRIATQQYKEAQEYTQIHADLQLPLLSGQLAVVGILTWQEQALPARACYVKPQTSNWGHAHLLKSSTAVTAPAEWPTTIALGTPRASSRPAASRAPPYTVHSSVQAHFTTAL